MYDDFRRTKPWDIGSDSFFRYNFVPGGVFRLKQNNYYHYRKYALLSILNAVHCTEQTHAPWLMKINFMNSHMVNKEISLFQFLLPNTSPVIQDVGKVSEMNHRNVYNIAK
jgi:hypothetical protein